LKFTDRPIEDKNCYASKNQREILLKLASEHLIKDAFFLTGGTALSVFYLHHRASDDIDLFRLPPGSLKELGIWIKRSWPKESVIIRESADFLSCLIEGVRVDLVIDPLSSKEARPYVGLEEAVSLQVDTLKNIISNKFCAAVRRMEPKDLVDVYFVVSKYKWVTLEDVYNTAREREVLFDDPPTAAYQIEESLELLRGRPELFPRMFVDFDRKDFFRFFEECTKWIYNKVRAR